MKSLMQALRLFHINRVFLRHGLDELVLTIPVFRPLYFLVYLSPWHWLARDRRKPRGVRIRRMLEDLGPVWVKFGQMLSTRKDLLPEDIAAELARLQDRVPAFPGERARAIVEKAYGCPVGEVFADFEAEPLASASIAQVHGARLHDGREVVVKVVRPDIRATIRRDLGIMYLLARLAARYSREARRLHPVEVVGEFDKTVMDELDLMREGANASQLRRNFRDSELLYVPEVEWELTRRNVMVMERIHGIPISATGQLRERGVDMQRLAERGVEIFFTQVFRHNFFHADMHPGNIFVDATDPAAPRYIAVDFGIMGSLTVDDQRYLAENFHAFFNRDYERVAELHVESGWVPADTRIDEFEFAIRTVCEPIFEKPLREISFGHFLLHLFQTARRFDMEVQPQLVLLQKTILSIEGLGRDLYPDLDLWATAKPFIADWMRERMGPRALLRGLREQLPQIIERLPEAPGMALDALAETRHHGRLLAAQREEMQALRRDLRRANQRQVSATLGAAALLGAAVVYGLDGFAPRLLILDAPLLTWILGGLGGALLLAALPRNDEDETH